ncbi:MAG: hypothetical protein DWQ47_02830 [Acidobacteria bacterium]|nr:MAG: hypothetical protein DWQ32_06380 [Acidobacteriota bacterium]REK01342.1 MAG: hypothetical protein DWQ38_02815 [Acidobacteriota bacterium]REK14298.1 MAG: hypothetical protein DWQ43_12070 [Acidobacteriota bacterium]REK45013.1 MAG: hypothetical protein DWQ47_02830 [Acidobacteriota bacterium]
MKKSFSLPFSLTSFWNVIFGTPIIAVLAFGIAAGRPLPTPTPSDDTVADYGREQTYDYFKPTALKDECKHIQFLGKEDEDLVPSDHKDFIVDPGRYQLKLTTIALNQLPELVCKSIGKVAFYSERPTSLKEDVINTIDDAIDSLDPFSEEEEEDTSKAVLAKVIGSHPDLINVYTDARRFTEAEIAPTYKKIRAGNEFFYDLAVSYSEWPEKMKMIIHEAGHCAQYLLDSQSEAGSSNAKPWPADLQSRARDIVKRTGLEKSGVTAEWKRVHNAFLELDLANAYAEEAVIDDLEASPEPGFLTKYAKRDAWEDFAETLAWMVINGSPIQSGEFADELEYHEARVEGSEVRKQPINDEDREAVWPSSWYDPCEPLRTVTQERVTSGKAAVYTKIMFLIDLRLIDEEVYTRCASNGRETKLRLNYSRYYNGFHRMKAFETGEHDYSHKDIWPVWAVHKSGSHHFRIAGKGVLETDDGKKYDQQMYLTVWDAKRPSLPRGLYTIKVEEFEIDMPCPGSNGWTFELAVPKATSNSFCATDGFLLITRSSRDFIEGKMQINTTLGRVMSAPKHAAPKFQVYVRWKRGP